MKDISLKEGMILDGILVELSEEDGFIEAVFEFRKRVRVEYHEESPEGRALRRKLTEDIVGQRVMIYCPGYDKEAIGVVVRDEVPAIGNEDARGSGSRGEITVEG